jgi:hypothetical protein
MKKSMEITVFKIKSRNLPVLIFGYSDLNIWGYRSPIDANSKMSYEGDMIFQRWHMNFASKQVW